MSRNNCRIIIGCPVCGGIGQLDKKTCPECGGNREIGRIGTLEEVAEFVNHWVKLREDACIKG